MATNLINNKVYIGQTSRTLRSRITNHYYSADKSKVRSHFHNALLLNNRITFEWDILEDNISTDLLDESERFWIAYFKYIGAELYNMTNGGESTRGYKLSKEHRNKLSESHKGKRSPRKGCIVSEETKIKQSLAKLGRPSLRKGVPMSEETRFKMSQAKKGKTSPRKGSKLPEEIREKISNSLKKYFKDKEKI
jgi:group I intron endonuclease